MLTHFLKIAIRNILKQKALSTINVFGLSVGTSCFALFLLFAVNEFTFDRFHKNAGNLYEVFLWTDAMKGEEAGGSCYLPIPLGPSMKQDLPEVEEYVRMKPSGTPSFIRLSAKDVRRIKVTYVDPQFFSVFTFPLKYGHPSTAFQELNHLVLTREKALEFFGDENATGRTIEIKIGDDFVPFQVSAVTEDIPSNSSIRFDLLLSFQYMLTIPAHKKREDNWMSSGYITYLKLRPGSRLPDDLVKLSNFRKKHYPEEEAGLRETGVKWKGNVPPIHYGLQPIEAAHTNPLVSEGTVPNINPTSVWILLGVAAGVLLIACINFTTLSIGRSAGRAREIGVRKVIGSERKHLFYQFMAEAFVMSAVSSVTGIALAWILLPYFNLFAGRNLSFSIARYPEMGWMMVSVVVIVGLVAGSYPALVLSGFKPLEVLKSRIKVGGSNFFTRSLVTLQFGLSICLIICTAIILKQTRYLNSKNLGFNKENVLVVDAEETKTKQIYPLFKQAMQQNPDVIGVASAELSLGAKMGWSQSGFGYKGKQKNVFEYYVDPDYIPVLGVELLAGRNFDPAIASDTITSVIINETMMYDFGWNLKNAVGQQIVGYSDAKTPVVIGVVKDFNFLSLKEKVGTQMFHQFADYAPYRFFVRIKPGSPAKALEAINETWTSLVPAIPFKYSFLDEDLGRFYEEEQRMNRIMALAGGLSIFLACLGLFGLAALAAVNRTREIGIRKVLGASVTGIISLLSRDFLKLVVVALVLAAPLSWLGMDKWLQNYAYRITIPWWVFAGAGAAAFGIALFTISIQALKVALANPVKSLRTE